MMKYFAALIVALIASVASSAEVDPFAYTESPDGYIVFYKSACPFDSKGEWHKAASVWQSGYNKGNEAGCWLKRFTPYLLARNIKMEEVIFCPVNKDEDGKPVKSPRCIYISAENVFKGNPLAKRAFN